MYALPWLLCNVRVSKCWPAAAICLTRRPREYSHQESLTRSRTLGSSLFLPVLAVTAVVLTNDYHAALDHACNVPPGQSSEPKRLIRTAFYVLVRYTFWDDFQSFGVLYGPRTTSLLCGGMNCVSCDICVYHLGLFAFFPGVFLSSRVT